MARFVTDLPGPRFYLFDLLTIVVLMFSTVPHLRSNGKYTNLFALPLAMKRRTKESPNATRCGRWSTHLGELHVETCREICILQTHSISKRNNHQIHAKTTNCVCKTGGPLRNRRAKGEGVPSCQLHSWPTIAWQTHFSFALRHKSIFQPVLNQETNAAPSAAPKSRNNENMAQQPREPPSAPIVW